MLWQLLGQFDPDELLVQIPEWLAEESTSRPMCSNHYDYATRDERLNRLRDYLDDLQVPSLTTGLL